MTIAPIVSLIAPARVADSAAPPAKGGFAALLPGQDQPAAPAATDAVLPEFAAAAGRLKQGEPALQPLGSEMPKQSAVPAEEGLAELAVPKGDAPAPQLTGDPQPQPPVDAQPDIPATPTTAPAATILLAASETAAPTPGVGPVKGVKEGKADRAGKTDEAAPSTGTDQPRLAETMLPVMPVQDQAAAAKPVAASAATALVAPQSALQPETVLAADDQAARVTDPIAPRTTGASISQPGAMAAAQDTAGPADRVADGAALPANAGNSPLSAPVSRPVAFSDVYPAAKSAQSPVVAAQAGTMGREMGVEIARHVTAGRSEMLVRLDPPEMGRIDIKLSFNHDGGLRAVMSADNQGALDLLRRETGDLARALSDAGVKADAQSFRFDSRGGEPGQRGQQQNQPWQHGREAGHGLDSFVDEQPLYRALRASGRVDLMA